MTIEIPMTKGYVAFVDDEDSELLQYRWRANVMNGGSLVYAQRHTPRINGKRTEISMHRQILEKVLGYPIPKEYQVDHFRGNGTDNRRENLRLATRSQNGQNKLLSSHNKSGVRGVHWSPSHKKWSASIGVNKRNIHLGWFDDFQKATEARRIAEEEYFGEFSPRESGKLFEKVKRS